MVAVESPETTVCYLSAPTLKCTFEEATSGAGWNISRAHQHFELNNGSEVELDDSCGTQEYKSCVSVRLLRVTGIWAGKLFFVFFSFFFLFFSYEREITEQVVSP